MAEQQTTLTGQLQKLFNYENQHIVGKDKYITKAGTVKDDNIRNYVTTIRTTLNLDEINNRKLAVKDDDGKKYYLVMRMFEENEKDKNVFGVRVCYDDEVSQNITCNRFIEIECTTETTKNSEGEEYNIYKLTYKYFPLEEKYSPIINDNKGGSKKKRMRRSQKRPSRQRVKGIFRFTRKLKKKIYKKLI